MDMDKTVCYCMSVTNGMIRDAVYSGASTVCGACMENVQRLVDFFVAERGGTS